MIDNNQYDAFDELFCRKLQNHQMPVHPDGWNQIEQHLRRAAWRPPLWLWFSGAVAAAAVIALFILINPPALENTTPYSTSIHIEPLRNNPSPSPLSPSHQIKTTLAEATLPLPKEEPVSTEPLAPDPLSAQVENNRYVFDQTTRETPQPNKQLAEDLPQQPVTLHLKKEKRWALAAVAGSGRGSFSGFGNEQANTLSSWIPLSTKSSGNDYAANLSASIRSFNNLNEKDLTSIRHLPPLSFGLLVRKQISASAELESGLIYTYLASRFAWSEQWTTYNVHQRLHYLGIPVNLVVSLWDTKPNWKIYFSAGITVEKGLRAIYTQEMKSVNSYGHTLVKSAIDGLQWSLNGAIGVNYSLNKNLGLYLEPRFGYCFDNNQPISMRTEWPFFVGFGMGLNIQFKK